MTAVVIYQVELLDESGNPVRPLSCCTDKGRAAAACDHWAHDLGVPANRVAATPVRYESMHTAGSAA